MLQRAASNAYSWWWASHVRTKQSKWLEQSLQDMEEKVANVLNLVQRDGDSFAKRAEMYYKHRPELIAFIEESVRAYRALAERYDKLSTELQNANTTIASVFPDQLPYDSDYDDDYNSGRKIPQNIPPKNIGPNAPKAPNVPKGKDLKGLLTNASKKIQAKKVTKADHSNHVPKSGLTKGQAVEEIDKLQKEILSMQTMKEFAKSSYENGLAKFWEIENKVTEMQQRICTLQDEFKVAKAIEDDDARAIMAEAALKSCKETLAKLEEKQEKSSQDARLEHERIEDAKQKLKSLKHKYLPDKLADEEEEKIVEKKLQPSNENEQNELQAEIKESLEELSKKPLTVTEMADTVDKLVNKVISLETLVLLQTTLVNRLRIETDDLQMQIRNLEDEKANLIDGTRNLGKTFKDMEKKLNGVQDLNQKVENQNNSLKTQVTEARCSLEHLSENLHNVKPDEDVKLSNLSLNGEEVKLKDSSSKHENSTSIEHVEEKETPCTNGDCAKNSDTSKETEKDDKNSVDDDEPTKSKIMRPEDEHQEVSEIEDDVLKLESEEEGEKDKMNWQEMLLSGLEDKEKVLLKEYTTILRKYKVAKKKLAEEEQKNQGTVFEMMLQVRDLKTLLAKRDAEIQQLKQKLKLLQEDAGKEKLSEDKEEVPSAEAVNKEDDVKVISVDESEPISEVEEKLRRDIDAILDENLDFWLRFSTAFDQVQKFKTRVEDLQQEIIKVKAKGTDGKSSTSTSIEDLRSEIRPIYRHLKEIQNELTIWLEQSPSLKNELQRRYSSLSNIQEEITTALREGMEEEEIKFSTHQAAKFQGEILNMQQENNRVNEELQAGLDHVTALKLEIQKTLRMLGEEFGLANHNHSQMQPRSPNRSQVPLRSFIFGIKARKQKPSIFACINHHKKFGVPKGGLL